MARDHIYALIVTYVQQPALCHTLLTLTYRAVAAEQSRSDLQSKQAADSAAPCTPDCTWRMHSTDPCNANLSYPHQQLRSCSDRDASSPCAPPNCQLDSYGCVMPLRPFPPLLPPNRSPSRPCSSPHLLASVRLLTLAHLLMVAPLLAVADLLAAARRREPVSLQSLTPVARRAASSQQPCSSSRSDARRRSPSTRAASEASRDTCQTTATRPAPPEGPAAADPPAPSPPHPPAPPRPRPTHTPAA